MQNDAHWHPTWYKDEYASNWERVKEAVRRDWEQTKRDFNAGGHALHQDATDTVKQAMGKERIPPNDGPNPAKVLGDMPMEWQRVMHPIEYGFMARHQFGAQHAGWNNDLERDLRTEWESNTTDPSRKWDEVAPYVRHGYDYKA